jgi:hypothetical protein
MVSTDGRMGLSAGSSISSSSGKPARPVRMLLKSWATPPARVPRAPIFRAFWSRLSSSARAASQRRCSTISRRRRSLAATRSQVPPPHPDLEGGVCLLEGRPPAA